MITFYTFKPPFFFHASGEIHGRQFLLSAMPDDGCMQVVVRAMPDLSYPLRFSLPNDVEQQEVELMLEILLGSPAREEVQAA